MTASIVEGILLSDLLKRGARRARFRMEEIRYYFLSLHRECFCCSTWKTKLLTNLSCGSAGFPWFGFRSLGHLPSSCWAPALCWELETQRWAKPIPAMEKLPVCAGVENWWTRCKKQQHYLSSTFQFLLLWSTCRHKTIYIICRLRSSSKRKEAEHEPCYRSSHCALYTSYPPILLAP